MDAKSTGQARRASVDSHIPTHYPQHEGLNQYEPTCKLPSTIPSASTSRNPSPMRSHDDAPINDDVSRGDSLVDEFLVECFGDNSEEERVFYEAPSSAPITKHSLSELDIGSIINNSKLRHDVNFDRELHFRPNMDGERGRRKRDAQMMYWRAVATELHLVFHVLQAPIQDAIKPALIDQCSLRLQQMFETIKEILKNLVPDRDQSDVDDHLDVPMLMQEISRGVCNFVSIAGWIAQLLKRHCAPMRDELVDRMIEKIEGQTPESITAGLVDLFSVLEAMKLDVANHQIRHLRALLIEDTVNFEKKYHFSRMKKSRYDCRTARKWYKNIRESKEFVRIPMTESYPNKDVEVFVKGFLRLLLPTAARLPDTFTLDNDRIRQLKAEIDETIRESICCDVLKELVIKRGSTLSLDSQTAFRHRLQIIAGDVRTSMWHLRAIDDIACEIVRFALQATDSSEATDAELEDFALKMLDKRLWALVRIRSEPDPVFEDTDDRDRIHQDRRNLFDELFSRTFRCVEEYLSSSPYDIFQALVPPPAPPPLCPMPSTMRSTDRQQDLVRKIAHIAILHWRTWEHLVYNNEDLDRKGEGDMIDCSSRTSTPGPRAALEIPSPPPELELDSTWAVEIADEACEITKAPA